MKHTIPRNSTRSDTHSCQMPPPASPMRRVLADKSTNASLNMPRQHTPQKPSLSVPEQTSPRRSSPLSRSLHRISPGSPGTGRKRRIEEVEDGASQTSNTTQKLSQITEILSDGVSEEGTSMESRTTMMTRFHASQEEQPPLEDTFEIHEEHSQRTVDKLVSILAVPAGRTIY